MDARFVSRRFLLLAAALLSTAPAAADAPTLLYELDADFGFQEGCFGECMCPVLGARMTGTFGLTPGGPAGAFSTWTVSDVDWQVASLGLHITGSGIFQAVDAQQQLILDLSINGGTPERYDSGLVPASSALPRMDAVVSLYGMQCFDRVLVVSAAPAARPLITFRFEGTVTSVFDGLGALDASVAPGTPFHGSFTFDTRTPNSAPPVDEGEAGLYHHEDPPAGVRIRMGHFTFRSVPGHPDFDVIVNNEFGFAGADEFGFSSRNNRARGLLPSAPVDRMDVDWLASTFTGDPLRNAELPRTPPDLAELGGGTLVLYGECTLCLGPAAFFRIEGTLTSLTEPVRVSMDSNALWWDGPAGASGFDVIHGNISTLVENGFAAATESCLADDQPAGNLPHGMTPDFGDVFWFAARDGQRSWDSFGLGQMGERDEGVATSGSGCP
jgi:hypothetical protein